MSHDGAEDLVFILISFSQSSDCPIDPGKGLCVVAVIVEGRLLEEAGNAARGLGDPHPPPYPSPPPTERGWDPPRAPSRWEGVGSWMLSPTPRR